MGLFVVCSLFLDGRIGPKSDQREERELKEKEVTELKRDPFVNGSFFK